MELKLEQVKNYLRVDTTEDDELILSLLFTAKKLCLGILRVSSFSELGDEHDFDEFKIPILYTVAYLYEHRENADFRKLTLILRALLFNHRKEEF
jgi:DNA packaging protein, QLRG family|nr:MAG TPA: head tail connector [Caudoviricetes sp.]